MGILAIVVIGLVAAVVARVVLPGRQPMGWVIALVLGLAGSAMGGIAGTVVSPRDTVFDAAPLTLLLSGVGAIVVLGLANIGHRLRA